MLNLFESRLHAIGEYLINVDKDEHTLMTYNDLEPYEIPNQYDGMNWISDEEKMEFRTDFIPTNVNMYIGDTEPNAQNVTDTWVENGDTTTTFLDKNDLVIHYQNEESTSSIITVWISDDV